MEGLLPSVGDVLNKQSRRADKGWTSRMGIGLGANKCSPCYEMFKGTTYLDGFFG
jgi:hypothetical protein